MNVSARRLVLAGVGVAGLAVLAALVLDLGSGASTSATLITGLHRDLLLVAIPVALVVEGALVYAVWRFHDTGDPQPTPDRQSAELAWTVATALVLLFVGVASYQVLAQPAVTAPPEPGEDVPDDAVRVEVTAHQWHWSVRYPDANVSIDRAERIVLPVDRPIRIGVASADVIHSFHAPRLGLKQDAIPGRRNAVSTRVTQTGEYRLYCAEYCGNGHARMRATIEVVPADEYEDWLAKRGNASAGVES